MNPLGQPSSASMVLEEGKGIEQLALRANLGQVFFASMGLEEDGEAK